MAADCDPDALDALARGEAVADRAALDAHLATCGDCARELAWQRAERDLVRHRDVGAPALDALWNGVAARLPPPPPRAAPYRTSAAPPREPARVPWRAFAAGAVAATVAMASVAALMLRVNTTERVQAQMASAPFAPHQLVRLEVRAADVAVTASESGRAEVTVQGAGGVPAVVRVGEGRYEVRVGEHPLREGNVALRLPRWTDVEIVTTSGDVSVRGLDGSLRVQTTSGDVRASRTAGAWVRSTSGNVELTEHRGDVSVTTSSGSVSVDQRDDARHVVLQATSGELRWEGVCGAGCDLSARATSGDVRLAFGARSGFVVESQTSSGSVGDALGLRLDEREGDAPPARYGDGAGHVAVATTSGNAFLAAR
ncbi:MAG: DUF4097 family beta strand repeat-containing protein [Polyangiales bacterium]